MITYPNQKIVIIKKPKYLKNYLSVGNAEWQNAYKDLNGATFAMYLYLASNCADFKLAASAEAVKNSLGLSKSSYHRAMNELEEKKYLVQNTENTYFFYTEPQSNLPIVTEDTDSNMRLECTENETAKSRTGNQTVSDVSTEISNIHKINNLSNNADAIVKRDSSIQKDRFIETIQLPKMHNINHSNQQGRYLSDMENPDELKELLRRFQAKEAYSTLLKAFNLNTYDEIGKYTLSKDLPQKINHRLYQLKAEDEILRQIQFEPVVRESEAEQTKRYDNFVKIAQQHNNVAPDLW